MKKVELGIMTKTSQVPEETSVQSLIDGICTKVAQLQSGQRYILGITGYPGAGKSTVSSSLVNGVNARIKGDSAMVVPMDGYHFSNEKLQEMNLSDLKGIPETFDAQAFIALLERLRKDTDKNVYCPLFDRSIEASIQDAIVIEPRHKLCVVEGNYLLLNKEPWTGCRKNFDEVWFLDVTFDTILPRLLDRHIQGGRTPEGAQAKVESTDLPNARLVEQTKIYADKLVKVEAV
jgi:pantothenate kinase